jgi:hypothetical protein
MLRKISKLPLTLLTTIKVWPTLPLIFVAKNAVPPFRFRAGGRELLKSAIDLGPAMKARITEQGYFLCRVKDD